MSNSQMGSLPVRVIRYGKDEELPEQRVLRAGPLTAILEGGDLRYIKLGEHEIVRRIYVAVRNHNWDTIEPRFTAYDIDERDGEFTVRFRAEHLLGEVDFAWDGVIEGTAAGSITLTMDGQARRTFLKNRIGFCVLHPMELAGIDAEVGTPEGTISGQFPTRISPHQPFFDIVSIRHPVGPDADAFVSIRFEGDLFEMEDQRNWTDASFKTYCTPLRIPYPVEIQEGEQVAQSVTLEVVAPVAMPEVESDAPPSVRIDPEPVGTLPPIGLGVASHGRQLSDKELGLLKALRPAHLWLDLELDDPSWESRLDQAAGEAQSLGCALELLVLSGGSGEGLERLIPSLAQGQIPVARLLVFPRSELTSTEAPLARARQLTAEAGLSAIIGGGSRAYFTELNRATLPLDSMDVVGYTINPQVHAFDNDSLVETLEAQGEAVRSAQMIVGERPLTVGPITLAPRFNPNATGPEPETPPGELPPQVDPRQLSLLGAGWTLGSVRYLASAGCSSLTYYETTGWRGVIQGDEGSPVPDRFPSRSGMAFPLYHILADIAEFGGGELLPVTTGDPLKTDALALRAGSRLLVLVASFSREPQTVSVELPQLTNGTIRFLDETTAAKAATDPAAFRQRVDRQLVENGDRVELTLQPFAVARITGTQALD